jgi:two-component system, LytTR family, response regulator LytT
MKILLIEDETAAAKNLIWMLNSLESSAEILGVVESVAEGLQWFAENPPPHLIISDIQLADGNSFELFQLIKPTCPVIFTTAFDEFALRSFEVFSIEYLLKPIQQEALERAIRKYKTLTTSQFDATSKQLVGFLQQINQQKRHFRKSFLVRWRDKFIPIKTEEFALFHIKEGLVFGKTYDDKNYALEATLEEIEAELDPTEFFRANRQFVVARQSILEIELYFNGRLLLKTKPPAPDNILISKERVSTFRKWMEAV